MPVHSAMYSGVHMVWVSRSPSSGGAESAIVFNRGLIRGERLIDAFVNSSSLLLRSREDSPRVEESGMMRVVQCLVEEVPRKDG